MSTGSKNYVLTPLLQNVIVYCLKDVVGSIFTLFLNAEFLGADLRSSSNMIECIW